MKKLIVTVSAAALLAGGGQAFARTSHQSHAATKVTIVMHDPGCHWFSFGGKLTTKLTVAGPVKLLNIDEAALKIVGGGKTRHQPVGKTVLLAQGSYAITMVGQAPDDNHLKLVVR